MTFSLNQGEMENCSEEYNAGIYWTWREKRQSVQRALLPSAMRCRETMSSYSDSRCRRFAFPVKKIDFHCQGISDLELSMSGIWASIELGCALRKAKIPGFETICVYSGEQKPETLQRINEENGLSFCGYLAGEEVEKRLGRSIFLIIIEAFGVGVVCRTRYSLST